MMKSIASENANSDLDDIMSSSQIDFDTKQSKKQQNQQAPSFSNKNVQSSVDDQMTSRDSLKIIQESKRSSFLISNTRKLQILKQIHLMNPEELYDVCLQILQKSPGERNHFDLQILQKTFQSIEFFQKFEEQSGSSALLNLYKMLQLETYDIHDLVIQQGTRGDRFFIILQGTVGVFIKPAASYNQQPSNPQIFNSQVTNLNKDTSKTNNQSQQSPTQNHSNQNFTQGSRNAASPFLRLQSPVDSVKNNPVNQTCNSLSNQAGINRNRNDSRDNNQNNQSLNIPSFSNITSDTVLQDNHGQNTHQQGEKSSQSQLKKEQENSSILRQQQTNQNSQIKNQSFQQQSQSLLNKTFDKKLKNMKTDQSRIQKSEISIPINFHDDDSIKIQKKENNQSDQKKQNSFNSSATKQQQIFQDNQSLAFLNILKSRSEKERLIFPPHEQKLWINVNQLKAGQSFGELALLNDAPRMANVVCNSICHFAVLNKKDFKEAIASIESQKIKGYIQFLQQVPGFDRISRRALNMIIYSFEIKTFTFRDKIFKEKQKADHLYIVKDGEFILQTSVNYQPPKDPAHYNYEEFTRKYIPANQNKAVRKIQLAVLSKGELFGDHEVFSEIPRCMDAICNSQKGEVFCISIQNLSNRCEILNERELLANLKQNSLDKHGIHEKMLKHFHGTSSSFQGILVNNQKLIADQRNTDCINASKSQSNSRQNIKAVQIDSQISTQTSKNNSKEKLQKDSLYEPLFITSNMQNQPRGKSAPSTARNKYNVKTVINNLIDEGQSKQDTDTNRSSFNDGNPYFLKFSDKILEFSAQEKKNQLNSQNSKKIDYNDNDITYNITSSSQERVFQSRQVPNINISLIKQNQTPRSYLNSNINRPMSSERSHFTSSVRNRTNFNNNTPYFHQDNSFIQIQNQSRFNSPRGKTAQEYRTNDLSKSQLIKQQNKRYSYSRNINKAQDKSKDNIFRIQQQKNDESQVNSSTKLKKLGATQAIRKQTQESNSEQNNFEKDLKSEKIIKAKKQILNQLNSQAQKHMKQHYQSVDLHQSQIQNSSSLQNSLDQNKAIDQSFKPSLAFSKLQINQHIDYSETRKQVLRKMRKFKQINYLNELRKSNIDQNKLQSEYTKINTIKSKGYVVINPHAFVNFVNIS